METNKTYDDLMVILKKQLTNSKDKTGWRDRFSVILTMPFYETKFYPDYFGYASDIYQWMSKDNKKQFDTWKMAMSPNPEEFSKYSSFEHYTWDLKDIKTSTWNIKSNHHYYKYFTLTGINPNSFDKIVEVGGGCRDMCKFVLQMGFKGEYVIVDLPQVQEIQKLNLRDFNQVKWTDKPVKKDAKKKTLFISTWALSELTLAWRKDLLDALKPEHYLITYQRDFEDIDNEAWFSDWKGKREELPWIYYDKGSSYIMK